MRSKQAIVLLNMGGISNLDEIEVFLKNMFLDPHILPIPFKFLRSLVANKIIKKSLNRSKNIYSRIGGKSPLLGHTINLAKKIEQISGLDCEIAMRYVEPFAQRAIANLHSKGVDEVVLFPLYPQYSTTTTLSSFKDFESKASDLIINRVVNFYKDRLFNELILDSIKERLIGKNSKDFVLIFSAHSLPVSVVKAGDPYEKECNEHVLLLKDLINEDGLEFSSIELAYQSKFDKRKWLEPSLKDKLKDLRSRGVGNVIVYPLSFVVDNLETNFELAIEYKDIAQELGFEEYLVAGCQNSSDRMAQYIANKALTLLGR